MQHEWPWEGVMMRQTSCGVGRWRQVADLPHSGGRYALKKWRCGRLFIAMAWPNVRVMLSLNG